MENITNEETNIKYAQVISVLQEWIDKQSHDRCWYYPDLFNKLIEITGVSPKLKPNLPPRNEFELGCKKYQDQEYRKV